MQRAFCVLLLLASAASASASPTTFAVNGTFDTGGTFSGGFTLDGVTNSILASSITVSGETNFPAVTYTSSGTGSPYIQGNNGSAPNDFVLLFRATGRSMYFWLSGTPATFAGGAVLPLGLSCLPGQCAQSREINGQAVRLITGGSVTRVPEPSTLGLLATAIAGMWLLRRPRRRGT